MRLIFYIILLNQLLNFLVVFAEKVKDNPSKLNSVNWEKVEENKSNQLKKIIWKSYKNNEKIFGNKNEQDAIKNKINTSSQETIYESSKILNQYK